MGQTNEGFSKFRSFFWPIYGHELRKFVPMLLLFFLISVNYHLLRIAKDALIITAPKSGAEVIPFLKVWAMLPTAILFTFLFTKLSNSLNRERLFYVVISTFLIFFTCYLFIFPFKEKLFLDSFADYLTVHLPVGLKGLIAIVRYWIYALFYVLAESWSTIMVSMLLWGFANDVTKFGEAKRFYALFGIGINSAGILAGTLGDILASSIDKHPIHSNLFLMIGAKTSWDQTFMLFLIILIVVGIGAMFVYRYLHLHLFSTDSRLVLQKKEKMSLREIIKYISNSKHLLCITAIVLSYHVAINLTEVLWKSQLKEFLPEPGKYMAYMSKVTFFIGIVATLGSYLISGNIIRRCGWKTAAIITPLIFLTMGGGFCYFLYVKQFTAIPLLWGMTPLALTVLFGTLQNILSRSAKYTVFDDTKEMAFIPLSPDVKLKSKSAIDGIGSRLGKSGSSLILQVLFLFFSSATACFPIIFVVLFLLIPMWIFSIKTLDKSLLESKEPA